MTSSRYIVYPKVCYGDSLEAYLEMCIIAVALQRLLKSIPGVGCPQHVTPQVVILH